MAKELAEDPMIAKIREMLDGHKIELQESNKKEVQQAVTIMSSKIGKCQTSTKEMKLKLEDISKAVNTHSDELMLLKQENDRLQSEIQSNKKHFK